MPQNLPPSKIPAAGRMIGVFAGSIFACVGLTLIGFLWLGDDFDDAPVFFKIMGSFVSLFFIAVGGGAAVSSYFASSAAEQIFEQARKKSADEQSAPSTAPGTYVCPHCGGRLTRADVSPLGDVKCEFCGAWFNVHGKS